MKKSKRRKYIKVIFKATLRSLFFCFKILVLVPMLVTAMEEGEMENNRVRKMYYNQRVGQLQEENIDIGKNQPFSSERGNR